MGGDKNTRRRCAIYTRKSSEEGLEQDFNSLHAQREACEAYIRSQAGEGWKLVPTPYDDGGYSGGNLDRPALKTLLVDLTEKKIDTVVVYKVDRLTRSLADFAKIVEVLDEHAVSFVSVTQQFNTTTSMGRLTLNMLLSFAQFEREVTGERIRDKIAASKRKGLWMGGFVPLGYEAAGRTLRVVETEAKTVRKLYSLYLELGTVGELKERADQLGLRSKPRTHPNKKFRGGDLFSRGHLYKILNNPLYVGRIAHKGETFEGQHPALIDTKTWERVQERLAKQAPRRSGRRNLVDSNPLRGKLFDERGETLVPIHTTKKGRRYRYYVGREILERSNDPQGDAGTAPWRLPAHEVESLVTKSTQAFLSDSKATARALRASKMAAGGVSELSERLSRWKGSPNTLLSRVDLHPDRITLSLDVSTVVDRPEAIVRVDVPIALQRRGVERRIVLRDRQDSSEDPRIDPALVKAIVRARRWFDDLASGRVRSLQAIATAQGVSDRYVGALMPMAFLAPAIVARIVVGTQPVELTTAALLTRTDLPVDWKEQEALLGCP